VVEDNRGSLTVDVELMKSSVDRVARILGVGLVFFTTGFVVILGLPYVYAIITGLTFELRKVWFVAFKGALTGALVAMLLASVRAPSSRDRH
jgi:hypothetical protein